MCSRERFQSGTFEKKRGGTFHKIIIHKDMKNPSLELSLWLYSCQLSELIYTWS